MYLSLGFTLVRSNVPLVFVSSFLFNVFSLLLKKKVEKNENVRLGR